MNWCAVVAAWLAAIPSLFRWWRVAQREHYLAGSVAPFAVRWARVRYNWVWLVVAVVGAVAAVTWWWAAVVAALALAIFPRGLGLKGRTSKLAWTNRLRRLAVLSGVLTATVVTAGLWNPSVAVVGLLLVPVVVDGSLWMLAPLERLRGNRWVAQAAATLDRSGARVVAITGSFGKTGTKVLTAHLLGGFATTVASPASFNNRMGLAKAINEHLGGGTEIFVAEMGTYGPGEIADLVSWINPEVAVMTAIGPVHLERMKTERRIAEAKREIVQRASAAVINIDHPELARVASEESGRIRVITISATNPSADVYVTHDTVSVGGVLLGSFSIKVHQMNLGCAIGAVIALGFDPKDCVSRFDSIPEVPHRQTVTLGPGGFYVVDDTYNSNPAGAKAALETLGEAGEGRKVVVTPGMVELGQIQYLENLTFAQESAAMVSELVVVGETNRKALVEGAVAGGCSVIVMATREDAVEWVRSNLNPGDAVLYENDLPDHYP